MNALMRRILLVLIMGTASVEAEAQFARRACRATGYFEFTYRELSEGATVPNQRTTRIDILQSDMEVVASSPGQTWATVTDAKRWACESAAACFVRVAAGADRCSSPLPDIWYETIKKPPGIESWRREVACNQALVGNVPGLRRTGTNTLTLVQTKVVATASRDGITRHADQLFDESDHVCWSPSGGGDGRPPGRPGGGRPGQPRPDPGRRPSRTDPGHQPTRTDPSHQPTRTDSSHQPSRTDASHQPSRTNPPSPVESIELELTPPTQQGKCPASVLMRATVKVREPIEVRWWVTGEGGYESPRYEASLTKPVNRLPPWRRHIDPQPDRGRMTQMQRGGDSAPVHEGYFQLWLETAPQGGRTLPLGRSERAAFIVDCNPQAPTGLKPPG